MLVCVSDYNSIINVSLVKLSQIINESNKNTEFYKIEESLSKFDGGSDDGTRLCGEEKKHFSRETIIYIVDYLSYI